jgi:hypothetical protein
LYNSKLVNPPFPVLPLGSSSCQWLGD